MEVRDAVLALAYLVASVLFIYGLKGLTHPRTAVRGNLIGAAGMLVAILVTLIHQEIIGYWLIAIGIAIGAAVGAVLALKIRMTAMPQLVALFNGFGGGASVLVAGAELLVLARELAEEHARILEETGTAISFDPVWGAMSGNVIAGLLAGLIGAVTFWGSLVAFAKLQEYQAFKRPFDYPFKQPINAGLGALALLLLIVGFLFAPGTVWVYWLLVIVASVLGVTLVNPIGGADMPVVIALLNSYSGLAACATGFVLGNSVLIIAGSLVGASGLILTSIMCKAMNRSLVHVLFGVLGPTEETASADEVYGGKIKATTAEEVAMLYDGARRAVIVPGYGMAVAQAQHAVRELANLLESRGVEVEFAIHPVAGRMPGHMNVLLAEAEVPYEKLKELDEVNPSMRETDVALVIGANDVVNPEARSNPASPIAGMPIVDVDRAKTVVVVKRSLSPGFAGIPNPLFANDNTLMYFGDGKKAILDLIAALKE
ncbi:MAG TPA: NAD(P)(+) transhydrogenase (Re/Si-specific) subunit beta [Thermoguttaceae bacterium]|nr:NAD(P)(+) transhydrogenase (Re/Si-specific) subunit beta [Thermoguttaceae bacterium]